MTTIELLILTFVLIAAFVHVFQAGAVNAFSWDWFGLGYTRQSFAASALVTVFFYWGWDVTANLGEETVNPEETAGNGGFSSVIVTIFYYLGFTIAALFLFSLKDRQEPHRQYHLQSGGDGGTGTPVVDWRPRWQ